jgi:hypothetical protein
MFCKYLADTARFEGGALHLLALPWLVNEVSVLLQLLELNFQSDIT